MGIALALICWNAAAAGVITNGALSVTVDNTNGAIGSGGVSVTFAGADFYFPGTPVSNFGLQNGTDTSTFVSNGPTGLNNQPVTVVNTPSAITVSGLYTGGGASLLFDRVYSIVTGQDVLRISTTFLNSGVSGTFGYFDTFDPDQGIDLGNGFGTYNDVFTLVTGAGPATVGQATELGGVTVVMGSLDPGTTVASGSPFGIFDGSALNAFFSAPFDGNGTFDDSGTHVGRIFTVSAGGSFTFTYDQAFGTTPSAAQAAFVAADPAAAQPVPEPSSLALCAVLGVAGAVKRIKRRRQLQRAVTV